MSEVDELEIELKDAPAGSEKMPAGSETIEKTPVVTNEIDAGVDELKKNLDDTSARLRLAEAETAELRTKVTQNQAEIGDNNLRLVSSAITQAEHNSAVLRAEYATALESGDYLKVAEVQDKLSRNAAKIVTLESGKEQLERHLETAKQTASTSANDPVEKIAASLSPKSAEFIRKHRDFVTDPRKNARLMGAHNYALAEGLVADTPEYFEYLEKNMGVAKVEPAKTEEVTVSEAGNEVKRGSPQVAPVSRSNGGPVNGNKNVTRVTLTKEQREIAEISGLTYEEYARNLIKAQNSGEIGRRQ